MPTHYHSLSIAEAIARIESQSLALPLIQRNFVWDLERITKLFDSILQGYPINSMLFWQVPAAALESVQMYAFIRYFSHYCWFGDAVMETANQERYYNKPLPRGKQQFPNGLFAVLDGQQRLTSLYMGLCGSYAEKTYKAWGGLAYPQSYPPKVLYLCVTDPAPAADTLEGYRSNRYQLEWREARWEDGQLQADTVQVNEEHTELWLRVGEVMQGGELSAEVWASRQVELLHRFAETLNRIDIPATDFERARQTLEQLHRAVHTTPYISYYLEEGQELARAVETFIRINNGGMVLGYADLLFSILSAQWTRLNAREEIDKVEARLRAYETGLYLEKGFILKAALVMVAGQNLRFELSQFTSQRVQQLEQGWERIAQALEAAARFIQESKVLFLTAPSLVTVLAYFLYQQPAPSMLDIARMRQWLIRAQLLWSADRTSTETKISRLVDIISTHVAEGSTDFPFHALVNKPWGVDLQLETEEGIQLEQLLSKSKWEGGTKFLLGLLQTSAQRQVEYDVDHCFPYHEAYNAERPDEQHHAEMNALANLQLLPSSLNRSKNGVAFQEWYTALPRLLEDRENRVALGVETQDALHLAHYYPATWPAYEAQDMEAERIRKFRIFYEGRRVTTLARLREVFVEVE